MQFVALTLKYSVKKDMEQCTTDDDKKNRNSTHGFAHALDIQAPSIGELER